MPPRRTQDIALEKEPLWYKNAVIYELHVRSFCDSNGDGIGDFPGLTQKLDYLRDLGVTALWLLPFYPSPLKDDGYDIADYHAINPIYGSLADFKHFLREAHRRGLRVITELVINHTSDQHPWFQRSRRARPGSAWRDFYVWSETPDKYREARIIFKDFEPANWNWDPVAQAYFWHRFYSHQPDLNFENPLVHRELTRALEFWLDLGVDGLRLDAVPYLYEREGTSCENLRETHEFLRRLRQHIDATYGDRMLLAEANQWPEDAVAYFGAGKGDECHMAFHFPLMPRLFMAVRMEDRVPIVDILEQTPPIPETSQWALFLRNHDELTLEMVTDEERDYMYRVYANDLRARINLGIRRRLAPLLGNDRKRIELLKLLLFSMPGTPVVYYGDEIGMGDNTFLGDRNGVRTPMQWSSDKNAGFSRASPHALFLPIIIDPEYHYETVNVEAQQQNPHSLLWWTKRVLALRQRLQAMGRGTIEFLHPENRKILAFVRRYQEETILVVANLSRFPQPVEIDLSAFQGTVPVEMFGQTEFPEVGTTPYFLTLGAHSAFWFRLEPKAARASAVSQLQESAVMVLTRDWEEIFQGKAREQLEAALPAYIQRRRWFGAKGRQIKSVHLKEAILFPYGAEKAFLTVLLVDYVHGDPEEYLLPLAYVAGSEAAALQQDYPQLMIARVRLQATKFEGVLHDAIGRKPFCTALLEAITRRRDFGDREGELRADCTPALRGLRGEAAKPLEPAVNKAEQSNTSVIYGDKLILKFFRRLENGVNPDLEIGRFLTSKAFPNSPAIAGWLEYRRQSGEVVSLALLSGLVADAQDAWPYTLDILGRYFERVTSTPAEPDPRRPPDGVLPGVAEEEVPDRVSDMIGIYIELARLLGQRTGEMHLALASDADNKDFAPEPFTPFYQRSLFQSMRNLTVGNFQLLRRRLPGLSDLVRPLAERVNALEPEIMRRFHVIREKPIRAMRIRCHGDFHLGQVLYNGKDFVIIDFEGEPARSLGERRIKRSPLRDVAGMLRSFDYATYAALFRQVERGNLHPEQLAMIEPWTRFWYQWVSAVYLKAYFQVLSRGDLLPREPESLSAMLNVFLLEKAIYEAGYELNHRPDWVKIPLQGILQLLEPGQTS